jgi:trehalose 6-phosphate phosphatase
VEWKGLTMSIHYRLVDKKNRPTLKRIIKNKIARQLKKENFHLRKGKKVFEILPSGNWNKGKVVRMLTKYFRNPATVFVGDDVTDESAFGAMKPHDVSVRVGKKADSKARYYLKSQQEVKNLLRGLVKL